LKLAGFIVPVTIGAKKPKRTWRSQVKTIKKLGEVTSEEARMAGLQSLEHLKEAWTSCYGYWNPNELVAVFSYV
jgi:hypothetical protein